MQCKSLETLLSRTRNMIENGDPVKAYSTLCEYIECTPSDAIVSREIGIFLQSVNMPIKAETFYLKSLEIDDNQALIYFNLGVIYQGLNYDEKAIEAYSTTIKLNPESAKAYANLAYIYNKLGDKSKTREYCSLAISKEPDNQQLKHMIASMGIVDAPETAHSDYIKNVFDNYAHYYDKHLIHTLKFKTPHLIFEEASKYFDTNGKCIDILDLGCGTGLCGELFKKYSNNIIGVDLSEKMIEEANKKHIYTKLIIEDIGSYINEQSVQFDLVVSSDVFIYIGKLDEIFNDIFNIMKEGALFVFSIETLMDSNSNYMLDITGRYKHKDKYIKEIAENNNLTLMDKKNVILREQDNKDVQGSIYSYKK